MGRMAGNSRKVSISIINISEKITFLEKGIHQCSASIIFLSSFITLNFSETEKKFLKIFKKFYEIQKRLLWFSNSKIRWQKSKTRENSDLSL